MGDTKAVEKENVLIQAGICAVTILPHLGGKIASIRIGDLELLQAPLAPYESRTRVMSFDAGDASGWDECMPSVAACTVETAAGPATVPDHGDLWRVEWQALAESANSVSLRGDCFSLPLRLNRTATLSEMAKGWRLRLNYKVVNTGAFSAPWSWVAHPLFAVEQGDRIVLPDSIHSLMLEGSAGSRLGNGDEQVAWPVATLKNGDLCDLSVVSGEESGIGDKLFAGPLSASENWCALERRRVGVRIRFNFDPAATPYLGLWLCYGGWPKRPGSKQMCVALEPATAPVDSLARPGPWSRVLAPGDSFAWHMDVEIETTSGVS
jgi:galactose mutarotase-like enzyme